MSKYDDGSDSGDKPQHKLLPVPPRPWRRRARARTSEYRLRTWTPSLPEGGK